MDLKYKICDPQSSNFGPLANTVNHLRVWSSTWPRLAWPIKKCKSLLRQCRQYYNDPWSLPATISPIISCDPNSHSRGKRLGNVWPLRQVQRGETVQVLIYWSSSAGQMWDHGGDIGCSMSCDTHTTLEYRESQLDRFKKLVSIVQISYVRNATFPQRPTALRKLPN